MTVIDVASFAAGKWIHPTNDAARPIESAVTGEIIARAGSNKLDYQAMLDHAKRVGGPALRAMTFHDRARMLKAIATHLNDNRSGLYELAFTTGATLADSKIDIDGGIGTMFVYASKGRRELPDSTTFLDGDLEQLSRSGTFVGQHICTPKLGVGIQINAFNFPVWGMLEKLAPTLLAGVPAIVKPATTTCHVTEACVRLMVDSGLLPEGSLQLITGGIGDLLERLTAQDVVSFTGSAQTALLLKSNPHLLKNAVPFIAEQDSLNSSVLGPDVTESAPEFELFIDEVVREMTTKAGQKCTAIRRIMTPEKLVQPALDQIEARLDAIRIGNPSDKDTQMGPLVSQSQRDDVMTIATQLEDEGRAVGANSGLNVHGADAAAGAFVAPMVYHCADPDSAKHIHELEAFGPISTIMPYRDLDHACQLLNRGGGSLVASVITHDPKVARHVAVGSAAWHGRIYVNDRVSMKESTGHGSPLPHMLHGGPGRAGGGEELGGIRGVMHYMQRTAIQGSPDMISAIGETWVPNSTKTPCEQHPFTKTFHELKLGETLVSESREISIEDIETFAHFTGDTFYAHMDEEAAKANPFFPGRVAHGYLLLSFAAGLFVQPDPGPVLANTGLSDLNFQKPVAAGDSIRVHLTVKRKTPRNEEYGEVRWNVELTNQNDETVATYILHTMNAF
jgi:oxepin-CoA hydrolase/3-oxo-5,6-dehydrosuberyl-CoA semialdehyde dehydrogenase